MGGQATPQLSPAMKVTRSSPAKRLTPHVRGSIEANVSLKALNVRTTSRRLAAHQELGGPRYATC